MTTTNDSTLGPQMRQSSTSYILLARQKSAIPHWCALGVSDATTEYQLKFQVYIPPVSLVSKKTPRLTPIASIARKADSNPPLQPLQMFHDATAMDPLPSVCDGGREAVNAMGFLPQYVRKTEKSTARPLPYTPATNPGHWSDSTPHPIGQRMGTICWFPLPRGYGVNQQV